MAQASPKINAIPTNGAKSTLPKRKGAFFRGRKMVWAVALT